jgi:hypothetical protein
MESMGGFVVSHVEGASYLYEVMCLYNYISTCT